MPDRTCPHLGQALLERYAPVYCDQCRGMVARDRAVTRQRVGVLGGLALGLQGLGALLSAVAWLALAGLALIVAYVMFRALVG